MKFIAALIVILGINKPSFAEEVFFAASEEVLSIAEKLQMKEIDPATAHTQVQDLNEKRDFNSTELSLIRKYIVSDYQPLAKNYREATQTRIDELSHLQTSRLELSRDQKIVMSVGLAIVGGLLLLDSQGKKIEFTW